MSGDVVLLSPIDLAKLSQVKKELEKLQVEVKKLVEDVDALRNKGSGDKEVESFLGKLIDTFYDFSKELVEAFDDKKKEVKE